MGCRYKRFCSGLGTMPGSLDAVLKGERLPKGIFGASDWLLC